MIPWRAFRADLDRKLAWLNEPGARDKLDAIFNSTPEEIAEAANALAARQALAKQAAEGGGSE